MKRFIIQEVNYEVLNLQNKFDINQSKVLKLLDEKVDVTEDVSIYAFKLIQLFGLTEIIKQHLGNC